MRVNVFMARKTYYTLTESPDFSSDALVTSLLATACYFIGCSLISLCEIFPLLVKKAKAWFSGD